MLVQIKPHDVSVEHLAEALRRSNPPVMGVLTDGVLALDVRTVRDDEFALIVGAMQKAVGM